MSFVYALAGNAGHWGGGWGGGGPWWILFPLFWALVIGIVIWLVGRQRRGGTQTSSERAASILASRYARGEIDTDEYQRRLEGLGQTG